MNSRLSDRTDKTLSQEESTPVRRPARRPNSLACEAAFRARVQELGGEVLEPEWLGGRTRHRIRCAEGHEDAPAPSSVLLKGIGICRTCSGTVPGSAEAAFRARVEELGGTLLEPKWLGRHRPHRIRCASGHEGAPRPGDVRQGDGICRICAQRDPQVAEAAFRARLAELGATLLESSYLGANAAHRVRCVAGHECGPTPATVRKGIGICRTCAGTDSRAAEAAFRARLAELGAVMLEPTWLGSDVPHRVQCAAGHECAPRPGNVRQGGGLCRVCVGRIWDALYVVADDLGVVKFGVTSGDPRPRLRAHEKVGLDQVVRLFTGLPEGVAHELETNIRATLRDAREEPVRGREYFPDRVLPLILDLIDHHSAIRALAAGAR